MLTANTSLRGHAVGRSPKTLQQLLRHTCCLVPLSRARAIFPQNVRDPFAWVLRGRRPPASIPISLVSPHLGYRASLLPRPAIKYNASRAPALQHHPRIQASCLRLIIINSTPVQAHRNSEKYMLVLVPNSDTAVACVCQTLHFLVPRHLAPVSYRGATHRALRVAKRLAIYPAPASGPPLP